MNFVSFQDNLKAKYDQSLSKVELFNNMISTSSLIANINQTQMFQYFMTFSVPKYLVDNFPHKRVSSLSLYDYEEVDECFKEHGILTRYRRPCSFSKAFLSLTQIHNETVNFWTHFLPALYLIWCIVSITLLQEVPLFNDEYHLPYACYMITSCSYMLVSSIAHGFSCVSVLASHVCYFMDYATLSLYSWGCAILYYNYAFPEQFFSTLYAQLFIPVAAFMTFLTTPAACVTRLVPGLSRFSKALRIITFVVPYVWVSLPLIYRIYSCKGDQFCNDSSVHHTRQFLNVILATFFYISRIPERFWPGRFDIIGQSHNLLHVFGTYATFEQMKGSFIDMQARKFSLKNLGWASSPFWISLVTPIIFIINGVITFYFAKNISKCEVKKL